jgi:hypothetical protein
MRTFALYPSVAGLLIFACLFMVLFGVSRHARSHVHVDPDGRTVSWYPQECCHDRDCQPVANVRVAPEGLWMTTESGHTVLIGRDEARRPSRDMRWHLCMGPDGNRDISVLCIFEPPSM